MFSLSRGRSEAGFDRPGHEEGRSLVVEILLGQAAPGPEIQCQGDCGTYSPPGGRRRETRSQDVGQLGHPAIHSGPNHGVKARHRQPVAVDVLLCLGCLPVQLVERAEHQAQPLARVLKVECAFI